MTAELMSHPGPWQALLEALGRLVDSDPKALATARTLADCERDEAVAQQLGVLITTLGGDPRAAGELLERARAWHGSLGGHLAVRRRLVALAYEQTSRMGTTPDRILDNPMCEWVAAISEDEIQRDNERWEREKQMRAELFHGDWELERQAWRAGTHPMHPSHRASLP